MPTWRAALLLGLFAIFAVVNTGNALHKGGDFDVFLESGDRVISGQPLYQGSSPGNGVIGPPFQALFFVPAAWMARLNLPVARLGWYVVNLAALIAGIWFWCAALAPHGATGGPARTRTILLSVAAIVLPVQTNFEHQNINPLLLCLTGGTAWTLSRGRASVAGGVIGMATALKAFPALLLCYLIVRRQWAAAAVGILVAGALTALAGLTYGLSGAWLTFAAWLAVNQEGGWPIRPQNQSIYAMSMRLAPTGGAWFLVGIAALLVAGLVLLAFRHGRQETRGASSEHLPQELALALGVAVLLSPIAWDHYLLLLFPLFLVVAGRAGAVRRALVLLAALLVSGISPALFGAHAFDVARSWSAGTIAGLLLIASECLWWGTQKKRPA